MNCRPSTSSATCSSTFWPTRSPLSPVPVAIRSSTASTSARRARPATSASRWPPSILRTGCSGWSATTSNPLDTTGAGDSLAAALLAELAAGKPLPEALTFAVAYASAVVARPSDNRHPTRAALIP
ncbi:hypothetical protein G3I17_16305 [Streptomyces sp. SID13031]|nr:hypothetical protein [Streptomyces sp. SID13031]